MRFLRIIGLSTLALAATLLAMVQAQQWILRYRAQQLMADMHQIRLYQSTWSDAQRLMNRWGAWGHYDGSCTAKDCRYAITLTDESVRVLHRLKPSTLDWLIRHKAYTLYSLLGGRYSVINLAFVVQDGAIWRTQVYVNLQVSPKPFAPEDEGYLLIVGSRSQQALRYAEGGGNVRGSDDDLSMHPYYKAGRPGGCTNCLMVGITYSTHTPQSEIQRLTSFNMSCLTRFFSCKMPEDLLPAAKEWHIYHDDEQYAIDQQSKSMPPKPCDIPLWALARDSGTVLIVDGVSISQEEYGGSSNEWAAARVVTFLKGASRWPIGSRIKILPFVGEMSLPPFQLAEHLEPGKRYVILPIEGFYGNPILSGPLDETAPEPHVVLPRCGVQEDTDEVRRELEKGFAQNDNLRGPELR